LRENRFRLVADRRRSVATVSAFDGGTPPPAIGTASQITMTSSGQRVAYSPARLKIDPLFIDDASNGVRLRLTTARDLSTGMQSPTLSCLSLASLAVSDTRALQPKRFTFGNDVVR
jgi:hypothetical protein